MGKNRKKNKGFTLIESMVVLFIVALLSVIAAFGYGQARRQKVLERADQRVDSYISYMRSASMFGERIDGDYPCGYGLSLSSGSSSNEIVPISIDNMDRLEALSEGEDCDESILGGSVDLRTNDLGDESLRDLGGPEVLRIEDSSGRSFKCLSLIFSSPRGNSYYCSGESGAAGCPPSSCDLDVFEGSDYFNIILLFKEGSIEVEKVFKICPSGSIVEGTSSC